MKKQKLYISLPITGYNLNERKEYARKVKETVEGLGCYEVVNPLDNGLGEDAPYKEHMKKDVQMLLDCDAILFCDGWSESDGCIAEGSLAAACGLKIFIGLGTLERTL